MNNNTYSQKLNNILNNLFHGILLMNTKGKILEFNDASLKILGKEADELIQLEIKDFINTKDFEDFNEYFNDCLNSKVKTYRRFETEYLESDHRLLLEIDCNQHFLSEDDNQVYVIGVLTDVTERVKLEEELVKQKETKKILLEKLEREEELNDLKTKFISIASHEFRTPLAGILSSIDLIKRYLTVDETVWEGFRHRVKLDAHMEKVKTSVQTLNQVLNQVLSIDTLREGEIQFIEEEFDLEELLKVVVDEFRLLLKDGQQLFFEFLSGDKNVVLDKSILKNVMICLLSNAVKYTPEGKNIFVSANVATEKIYIEIKDEGIGIPKAGQKYLFKRFYKAKNAKNLQGIGLGLNIALRYVHIMNGDITFESEEGRGTTFKVCFEKDFDENKEIEFNEKDIVDRG